MAIFESAFGREPVLRLTSPGRVNLLGEHVDYSAGMVLPMALELGVEIALAPNSDAPIEDRVASAQFSGIAAATLEVKAQDHWADYVRGALQAARKAGWATGGYCIALDSRLPHGSGLSSSAAVIVGVLRALAPHGTALEDIARRARAVENEFIGVPCGIMDQMAVAIARPNEVLALDTLTLEFERVALPKSWHVAVIHSGVSRALADGRYGERRNEILAAADALGVEWLCRGDLARAAALPAPLDRRARHVMSEDTRTRAAADALKREDFKRFVALVNEGQVSIAKDFEITTPEVDAICANALRCGAAAARQTGGGFGGCIVLIFDGAPPSAWWPQLNRLHPATRLIVA